MNQELWDKIVAFDFDNPPSEYGFSTRLANENYWTKEFTLQVCAPPNFAHLKVTKNVTLNEAI